MKLLFLQWCARQLDHARAGIDRIDTLICNEWLKAQDEATREAIREYPEG